MTRRSEGKELLNPRRQDNDDRDYDMSLLRSLLLRTPAERMDLHDLALSQALTLRHAMGQRHV